jgi:hypothetical protein
MGTSTGTHTGTSKVQGVTAIVSHVQYLVAEPVPYPQVERFDFRKLRVKQYLYTVPVVLVPVLKSYWYLYVPVPVHFATPCFEL